MARMVISKDYPSHACYQVPLLIQALREQRGWKRWRLAEEAEISLREVTLLETPGHRTNLDTLQRVVNALDLTLERFFALAATVALPADRSQAAWPPLVPLALPPLPKWARPTA